jgi:hypothetical protein
MAAAEERPLGEILLAHGALDEAGLAAAFAERERSGRVLGEVVVALGLTSSAAVSRALDEQRGWSADSSGVVSAAIPVTSPVPVEGVAADRADTSPATTTSARPARIDTNRHYLHAGLLVLLLLKQRRFRPADPSR